MSTESIKKLVQYENEAKELLDEAYRKYDSLKKQASEDAKEAVEVELINKSKKIEDLKVQVDKYIEIVEKNKKDEYEDKISSLLQYENKDALIDELLKKVCKK